MLTLLGVQKQILVHELVSKQDRDERAIHVASSNINKLRLPRLVTYNQVASSIECGSVVANAESHASSKFDRAGEVIEEPSRVFRKPANLVIGNEV